MKRYGSAVWQGNLKNGKGTVSTESGTLDNLAYSFVSRFEQGKGTNPEELIGAAHAGCFSMALSAQLENDGLQAEEIHTKAHVSLEKKEEGFVIPAIHLEVTAKVPQATEEQFKNAAERAKEGCPISKLMNAEISMSASLKK